MEVWLINYIFFGTIGLIVDVVMLVFIVRYRKTIFVPVDRGVPYWYNPEDEIMYTRPVEAKITPSETVSTPQPMKTSFSETVELMLMEDDISQALLEMEKEDLKPKKRKVRR